MSEDSPRRISPEELELEPVEDYDPRNVSTVSDAMRELAKTAFEGGELGRSARTLFEMVTDRDTFVVMTVSGAMTAAGMSTVMCEIIDQGWVQAVVSTGALIGHDLVTSTGLKHYRRPPDLSDEQLQGLKMNRIYTVLEPEQNLDHVEEIFNEVVEKIDPAKIFSSRLITHEIGKYLDERIPERGILKSAYQQGVPVFITPESDSELGLDFLIRNDIRYHFGNKELAHNSFIDNTFFAELIVRQALLGKKLAIFTIGGGVPRNWAQQVGPYIELREERMAKADPNYKPIKPPMYQYGMRICPEPVGLGGLSGCTYSEGKSWRKFVADATTAEVLVDATIAWPLVTQAVLEDLGFQPVQKDVFAGKEAIEQIAEYVRKRYYPNAA